MNDKPKPDLTDPFEIAQLVRRFYARIRKDDLLGPIFDGVAKVDWSAHLPKLTAFWSGVLLGLPGFQGAPMRQHALIHMQPDNPGWLLTHGDNWPQRPFPSSHLAIAQQILDGLTVPT